MLLPTTCPLCGAPGEAPCAACLAAFPPPPVVGPPPGLDRCTALWSHEGPARDLVVAFKYRNAHRVVASLGDLLAGALRSEPVVDLVTHVPTTRARRRQRGFDQAELLARRTARRLGVPWRRTLVRCDGPAQTGHGRRDRLEGAWFRARRHPVAGVVVIVDDVCTTGASLTHAADVLRARGAWQVIGAVLTRRDRTGVAPAPPGRATPEGP